MYLSGLSCIKKLGRPPSASCPVNRNVNEEESLPLVLVSKRCTSFFFFFLLFFEVEIDVHVNPLLGAAWPIVCFLPGRLGMATNFARAYRFVCPAIVANISGVNSQ